MATYSVKDVAKWMAKELDRRGELYQDEVVADIEKKFGDAFVYENDRGNLAIDSEVLTEFKKLTPNAVWIRREKYWREREDGDEPGRNQSY